MTFSGLPCPRSRNRPACSLDEYKKNSRFFSSCLQLCASYPGLGTWGSEPSGRCPGQILAEATCRSLYSKKRHLAVMHNSGNGDQPASTPSRVMTGLADKPGAPHWVGRLPSCAPPIQLPHWCAGLCSHALWVAVDTCEQATESPGLVSLRGLPQLHLGWGVSETQTKRSNGQAEWLVFAEGCAGSGREGEDQNQHPARAASGCEMRPGGTCGLRWRTGVTTQPQPDRDEPGGRYRTPPSFQPLISLRLPMARPDQNQRVTVIQCVSVALPRHRAGQRREEGGPRGPTENPQESLAAKAKHRGPSEL